MKIKSKFLVLIILILVFLLSSCGKKEVDCSSYNTNYKKYSYDEESKECVLVEEIEKDICGNGVIEEGETYCNCEKDVPKDHETLGCNGSKGEYLEYSCNENKECVLLPNEKVVNMNKKLEGIRNNDLELDVNLKYTEPFITNLKERNSVLEIDIQLYKKDPNVKNLKVESIEILDEDNIQLGKTILNTLLSFDNKISKKFKFTEGLKEFKEEKNIEVVITLIYQYEKYDRDGNIIETLDKKERLSGRLYRIPIINAKLDPEER